MVWLAPRVIVPLPVKPPLKVKLLAVALSIVEVAPAWARMVLPTGIVALFFNAPPANVIVPVPAPALFPSVTVPLLMVTPPPKVFALLKVNAPLPSLVKLPVPAMALPEIA